MEGSTSSVTQPHSCVENDETVESLPDSSPEANPLRTSTPDSEDNQSPKEPQAHTSSNNGMVHQSTQSNPQPTTSELEAGEVDKLFQILTESESAVYRSLLAQERTPMRRFTPYPVHQQLFLQQQHEQERRRLSMSAATTSEYLLPRNFFDEYRHRHTRIFSDISRNTSVKRVISFIDTLTTKKTSTEKDYTEKCVICMNNYSSEEELRELRCTHNFHRKCIDQWLVKSSFCPVCRANISGNGKSSHIWEEYGSASDSDFDFDMLNEQDPLFDGNDSNVPPPHDETKE